MFVFSYQGILLLTPPLKFRQFKNKKCQPQHGHSRGTIQRQRSCQNSCSIHVYIVPMAAEFVQRRVCFVNVQLSLPKNVVFSVCARMGNAAYIIFSMWSSISGLDARLTKVVSYD